MDPVTLALAKGARWVRTHNAVMGNYHAPNNGTMGTSVPAEAALYCIPWALSQPFAIDRIGVDVTSAGAAGAVIRLGWGAHRAADGEVEVLADAGTVDATTTGAKEITVDAALPKGLVYLLFAVQGGAGTRPTIRHTTGDRNPLLGFRLADISVNCGSRSQSSGVTGAFGTNYPAVNATTSAPFVFVRAKAP